MSPVSVFLLVTSVSTLADAQTVVSRQERCVTTAAELIAAVTGTVVVDFASRQRDYPNGEKFIFSFSGFSGVIGRV